MIDECVYFQDIEIDWGKATKEYRLDGYMKRTDYDKQSSYLFKSQLDQVFSWVDNFLVNREVVNQDKKNINNIFSVVGDRGTGKSSFMESISYGLEENRVLDYNKSNLFILPPIDPTIFDGTLSFVELFVAMLKEKADLIVKDGNSSTDDTINNSCKFNKKIKEVVKILKKIRLDKSEFVKDNSGVEVLTSIRDQQRFFNKINELVQSFLTLASQKSEDYSHIVITIDDLDLVPNENVYTMLQDIFKFFKYQDNIIVFLAYREEQLTACVVDSLLEDNQRILKHEQIAHSELRKQASNFIEKGLPRPQRVYLSINIDTDVYGILVPFLKNSEAHQKMKKIIDRYNDKTDERSGVSLQRFIQKQIMEQARIQIDPVEEFELTRYTYPDNLRGTLQYLEVLQQLKNYQQIVEKRKQTENIEEINEEALRYLIDNLETLQNYLLTRFRETLSTKHFDIITDWLYRNNDSKNSFILQKLYQEVERIRELTEDEKQKNKFQVYNVSVGDVYTACYAFNQEYRTSEEALHFLYAVKVLYSLISLLSLVECMYYEVIGKVSSSEEKFKNYSTLVQGKIMPDHFYYCEEFVSGESFIRYNSEKGSEYNAILDKIIFSNVAAEGDIRKYGRQTLPFSKEWHQSTYRDFYEKTSGLRKGDKYLIDPFASITNQKVIKGKISKEIHKQQDLANYFFYSMFDLDFFTRKMYTRRSIGTKAKRYEYVIRRVNDCFIGDLSTPKESEMAEKITVPLFQTFEEGVLNNRYDRLLSDESFSYESLFDVETRTTDEKAKQIEALQRDYKNKLDKDTPNYEVKKFIQQYYKEIGEWPTSLSEEELKRAKKLAEPSNRQRKMPGDIDIATKVYKNIEQLAKEIQ